MYNIQWTMYMYIYTNTNSILCKYMYVYVYVHVIIKLLYIINMIWLSKEHYQKKLSFKKYFYAHRAIPIVAFPQVRTTVYVNKKSPYSTVINHSVVSLSHYSSSTVVLAVIGVLINSTPQ